MGTPESDLNARFWEQIDLEGVELIKNDSLSTAAIKLHGYFHDWYWGREPGETVLKGDAQERRILRIGYLEEKSGISSFAIILKQTDQNLAVEIEDFELARRYALFSVRNRLQDPMINLPESSRKDLSQDEIQQILESAIDYTLSDIETQLAKT